MFGFKTLHKQRDIIEKQESAIAELAEKYDKAQIRIAELYDAGNRQDLGGKNKYTTTKAQVTETIKKFEGRSEYGCELVQRIVALCSALTLPHGVDVVVDEKSQSNENTGRAELEFIKNWLDDNNLDQAGSLDLAQEAHLQGKILMTLDWVSDQKLDAGGRVIAQYRSWLDTNWDIDYAGSYKSAPYEVTGSESVENESKEFKYDNDRFSFLFLNGRFGQLDGRPRVAPILNVLENLSADLADWRNGNKFFGHKTPYFKGKDKAEVDTINNMIKSLRWRVGTALAGTAEFDLVGGGGSDHLAKSIETSISIISAATGISPHFLGFPQLLSNRATAESMGEPTEIVTSSEARRWYNFFEDLYYKVIKLRNVNKKNGIELNPDLVKPKIVGLSDRQVKMLKEVLLPALQQNAISVKTFISQLPLELDPEEEYERIKEQNAGMSDDIFLPESGFAGQKEPVEDEE